MNMLVTGDSQREHSLDGGGLDDGTNSLCKVKARALSEAVENPTIFVAPKRTIGLELVLEYPLASDHIRARRTWNEVRCDWPTEL